MDIKMLPEYNENYQYTIGVDMVNTPNDTMAFAVMRKDRDGNLEVVTSDRVKLGDTMIERKNKFMNLMNTLKDHFKTDKILGV